MDVIHPSISHNFSLHVKWVVNLWDFYFFSMGFFYRLFNRAHNFGLHNVFIKWIMGGWMDEETRENWKQLREWLTFMDEWVLASQAFLIGLFWLYHINKILQFRIVNHPWATNTHQFLHHENVYHRLRNFRVLCAIELFRKYPKLWVWGPVLPKLGTK
jgi:hypothetical protein